MASEETQRVQLQRAELGEEGLKERTARLEAAKAHNEVRWTCMRAYIACLFLSYNVCSVSITLYTVSLSVCVVCVCVCVCVCLTLFPRQIPAPDHVVSSLSVPGTDSIQFHPLVAMGNHQPEVTFAGSAEYSKMPVHKLPFSFQVNHMHSGFVEVHTHTHTHSHPHTHTHTHTHARTHTHTYFLLCTLPS